MLKTQRHRRGISLIELTIAIAAGATILMLATAALSRMIGMRHTGQDHLQRVVAVGKLAEQFRSDVWAARRVTTQGEGAELSLFSDDERHTQYTVDSGVVSRSTFAGEKLLSQDSFETSDIVVERVAVDTSGTEPRASLLFRSGELSSPKAWQISAIVGRDYRYATQSSAP